MDFFKDFWGFLKTRKKYWLLPIIITLLLFGVLIVEPIDFIFKLLHFFCCLQAILTVPTHVLL